MKNIGPNWPYPHRSPVASKLGFTASGMLVAHCHHRASHSPRVAPPHGSSGASTSTSLPGAVDALVADTSVVAERSAAVSSGAVVAPAIDATASTALAAHNPAANAARERIINIVLPQFGTRIDPGASGHQTHR